MYRNYYPEEWLDFVSAENTKCVSCFVEGAPNHRLCELYFLQRYTLEIRDTTGHILSEHALASTVFHHPTRDLACAHFADEIDSIARYVFFCYFVPKEKDKTDIIVAAIY
jgi:hypothetical protein